MTTTIPYRLLLPIILLAQPGCKNEGKEKALAQRSSLDLKRGTVISCGPRDGHLYGSVLFEASIPEHFQADFNTGIALLHSFEYDEAEKMFAKVIDGAQDCAMAYWGVAMSNFHPLWAPPLPAELTKGSIAIEIARSIKNKTQRESDYIEALGKFFEAAGTRSHRDRVLDFESAMATLYTRYTNDKEAAIFYALALNAAADPSDKTYARQKKAIAILMPVFNKQPLHPGPAHYIIHNCDYPELATLALPAARKYAAIAPASAHAQHMPSHIFTRLGLWDESIQSNKVAQSSAKCYAEQAKLKGHWDEELHATDYLVYAYLQKGQDQPAKKEIDYLLSFSEVDPLNFKTAYTFAACPARYLLERKKWQEAANYQAHPANFPWDKYPWQKALIHFTRLLGAVHITDLAKAKIELHSLDSIHTVLQKQPDKMKEAMQVAVQVKTGEAWMQLKEGNKEKAIALMTAAADLEDGMEKHPVTPGEVVPARELLGEMLLQLKMPAAALQAFEESLKNHFNRFNSLYGAGLAAMQTNDREKALNYFKQLVSISSPDANRMELQKARSFLANVKTV